MNYLTSKNVDATIFRKIFFFIYKKRKNHAQNVVKFLSLLSKFLNKFREDLIFGQQLHNIYQLELYFFLGRKSVSLKTSIL